MIFFLFMAMLGGRQPCLHFFCSRSWRGCLGAVGVGVGGIELRDAVIRLGSSWFIKRSSVADAPVMATFIHHLERDATW